MRSTRLAAASAALALLAAAPPLAAQATFRIVVDTITESRERSASNDTSGQLTLMPKLDGAGLEEAKAFRIRVNIAQDDTGQSLLPDEPQPAEWEESATGQGLWIRLASPARGATTATVAGTIELWVPGRDRSTKAKATKPPARPGKTLLAIPFELKDVPLP